MESYLIPKARRGRYLITGGGGFLGAHLCRKLLSYEIDALGTVASCNEVLCVDHLNNGNGRIKDLLGLPGFRSVKPGAFIPDELHYILHFGSYPSPKDHLKMPLETLSSDAEHTINLIRLAEMKKSVFMLASTGHIDQVSDPTVERGIYAEGKRFAEAYTSAFRRQYGTEIRIVRMFNSYGPGMRPDDGRVVPAFISKALSGEPLTILGGRQKISLTYVDDMIGAILTVLYSGVCRPVEIGSAERISIGQLAELIVSLTGSRSRVDITPQGGVQDEKSPDLEAISGLGWKPSVSLEEGLRRTIDYFMERRA